MPGIAIYTRRKCQCGRYCVWKTVWRFVIKLGIKPPYDPAIPLLGIYPATAKSLQSCPTLCDPIDGSPTGFPIPGILQARTLEWVAISFSSAWKWKVKVKSLSCIWLLGTPWTAAYQAPPSMGFSKQEYWSGVPLPSPMEDIGMSNKHTKKALNVISCKEMKFESMRDYYIPS